MNYRGRPVRGAISGFFLGLFVGLDLLFLGVVALDSAVITILPVVGLVLGIAVGIWAPFGRAGATPAMAGGPPPPMPPMPPGGPLEPPVAEPEPTDAVPGEGDAGGGTA